MSAPYEHQFLFGSHAAGLDDGPDVAPPAQLAVAGREPVRPVGDVPDAPGQEPVVEGPAREAMTTKGEGRARSTRGLVADEVTEAPAGGPLDALCMQVADALRAPATVGLVLCTPVRPHAPSSRPFPAGPRTASVTVTGPAAVRNVLLVEWRLGEGPMRTCLQSKHPIESRHLGLDTRWPRFGRAVRTHAHESLAAAPILVEGKAPHGVLAAFSENEDAFDADDVRVLSAFGRVLGGTLVPERLASEPHGNERTEDSVVVNQAVGILMSQGCDEKQALRRLTRISQATSEPLAAAALMIVSEAQRQAHLRYISQTPLQRVHQYLLVGL